MAKFKMDDRVRLNQTYLDEHPGFGRAIQALMNNYPNSHLTLGNESYKGSSLCLVNIWSDKDPWNPTFQLFLEEDALEKIKIIRTRKVNVRRNTSITWIWYEDGFVSGHYYDSRSLASFSRTWRDVGTEEKFNVLIQRGLEY